MVLPKAFVKRMETLMGSDAQPFLQALAQTDRSYGLRTNTLKLSPQQLQSLSPWALQSIPWSPSGFYYPPEARPGPHPLYYAGLYYIQEPSAQAVAELAAAQPGERVLDLCASPGGKTTHLAAQMQGQGLLVANEVDGGRIRGLLDNIERWGASVAVVSAPLDRLAEQWGPYFDRVVLDAPCSGEGMFRKEPEAIKHWGPSAPERAARLQKNLIQSAGELLRPGGVLVYSTCTFAPEENEGVIEHFLQHNPDFALEDAHLHPSFAPGQGQWVQGLHNLQQTARLWPHRLQGEGHFLAKLRRLEGPEASPPIEKVPPLSRETLKVWQAWALENLTVALEGAVVDRSGHLYWLNPELPSLNSLKALAPGLYLGKVQSGRFLPGKPLAHYLVANQVQHPLPLDLDDPLTMRLLRGEAIMTATPDSEVWIGLRTTQGVFALGWGKVKGGVLRQGRTGL